MIRKINIVRIKKKKEKITDNVVEEKPLTIFVNKKELITLLCSPNHLKYLIIGFLISENIINNKEDIKKININKTYSIADVEIKKNYEPEKFQRRIITSGCSGLYSNASLNIKKIKNKFKIKKNSLLNLMRNLQLKSKIFQSTGGVHSSALCTKNKILFFTEDIGRHNTIDKIIGFALLKNVNLKNKIILTTGRLSSEMVLKIAKQKIPLIASKSAPTDLAVKLAKNLNITLIGFVRGSRINVYNNEKKIIKK